jgi:uncharacterized protein
MKALHAIAVLVAWASPTVAFSDAPPADSPAAAQAKAALRTKQFEAAISELQAAAEHGDTQSQYLLGLVYANGVGTPISQEKARRWLGTAGDKSHAEAAFALSGLLVSGSAEDRAEAQRWLARAASLGHAGAKQLVAAHALPLAPAHNASGSVELARELLVWAVRKEDEQAVGAFAKIAGIDAEDAFGRTALDFAVISGSERLVKHLLAAGAKAVHADHFGVTPLMLAAEGESTAILEAVLRSTRDVDGKDQAGNTALVYAARVGRIDQVSRLLAIRAAMAGENTNGWSVLDTAAKTNHPEVAQLLRKAGAIGRIRAALVRDDAGVDITHGGEMYTGWQPLAIAASRNDARLVEQQLSSGARPDELTPQRDTALLVAAKYGAPAVVAPLLHAGANPARPGADGHTPLCYAAAHSDVRVLDALLQKGVSPETHGHAEDPALVLAARAGDQTIVKRLIDAGADVNAVSPLGLTPTMVAAAGSDTEVLRMLIDAKANLAARDRAGRQALWFAAGGGNAEMVEMLLIAGAPVEAVEGSQSPLFAAVRAGRVSTVERMLRKGLAPDEPNGVGDTPLIAAAARGDLAIVRVLLDGGAAVNAQNHAGNTALIVAIREGHTDVCKALVQAGANTSLRNQERHDALDTAQRRNLTEIVALLTAE